MVELTRNTCSETSILISEIIPGAAKTVGRLSLEVDILSRVENVPELVMDVESSLKVVGVHLVKE